MTWGIRAQRRADDFDSLVGRSSSDGLPEAPSPRDAELLELVGALRAIPDVQPRPEFVADLRGRLLAEADTALVPTDVSKLRLPARRTKRERRIAAVVGAVAIVGASTSVALASQSALPGESLYPIKRVIESAHTGLSLGEARKGSTELANASSRLDEVTALTESDGLGDDQRVARTLGTFTEQATSGADLLLSDYAQTGRKESVVELRDFASSSMEQLTALEPRIPYVARDELIAAAGTIAQIDTEAAQQCPSCGGAPIGSIPPALLSAEQVDLPSASPAASPGAKAKQPKGSSGTKSGSGAPGTVDDPTLPDLDGAVPPGSVSNPDVPAPSTSANPLQGLTDGLTGILTGGKGTPAPSGSATSGSSASPGAVNEVLGGVGAILNGVLDPITGQLVPRSPSTP
ncbi:DUF5667 domain-containing protein [Nocardioides sp. URHA0020]|uniref:DUF5667 domain-containing protein n=1 Tax=Nocardioides sp. URHA0020 TaxID=1380392 RepID=UPI00048E15E4|nr:DUF5667 domain-containing protein [Nocardioides sp. URHA0020]